MYSGGSDPYFLLNAKLARHFISKRGCKSNVSYNTLVLRGEMICKSLHLLCDIKLIFSKSEIMMQGARTWGSDALCGLPLFQRVGIPDPGLFPHHPLLHILHFASYSRCVLTHRLMHQGAVINCSKVRLKNRRDCLTCVSWKFYHCNSS